MARHPRNLAFVALTVACVAGAQVAVVRPLDPRQPEARPVDAGVGDVSPLQRSLRTVPLDLRLDSGFSRVVELERPTRLVGPGAPRVFARRSGAITAIFPESSYTWSNDGRVVIEVPAGTVYQIGDMPRLFEHGPGGGTGGGPIGGPLGGLESGPGLFTGVDLRADLAAPVRTLPPTRSAPSPSDGRATGPDPVVPPARAAVSLWFDDEYRVRRVGTLLDAALRREVPGGRSAGGG